MGLYPAELIPKQPLPRPGRLLPAYGSSCGIQLPGLDAVIGDFQVIDAMDWKRGPPLAKPLRTGDEDRRSSAGAGSESALSPVDGLHQTPGLEALPTIQVTGRSGD